jgi:undecaprenyl-phosphate 4-deoxy-4-formamido-L-arabinose transferase
MGLEQLKDCDMVATMDDDGAHPVELLDALMEGIRQGAELCYAVPVRKGYSPLRRAGSLLRDFLFSLLAGKPRGVKVSAFRVMTGDLALRLRAEPDGFFYLSAAAFAHRPKASFVTYEAGPEGGSSYTFSKLWRLYAGLVLHYTPLKALYRMKAAAECPRAVLPGRGTLWQP